MVYVKPQIVAVVYSCPKGMNHTHKVKLGDSFSCHGTVYIPDDKFKPN